MPFLPKRGAMAPPGLSLRAEDRTWSRQRKRAASEDAARLPG